VEILAMSVKEKLDFLLVSAGKERTLFCCTAYAIIPHRYLPLVVYKKLGPKENILRFAGKI